MFLRMLVILLIHLLFLLMYPNMGPYGTWYMAISVLLWCGFSFFIGFFLKLINFFSSFISGLATAAVYVVVVMSVLILMPQADNEKIINKMKKGDIPKISQIYKNAGLMFRKAKNGGNETLKFIKEKKKETERLKDKTETKFKAIKKEIKEKTEEVTKK